MRSNNPPGVMLYFSTLLPLAQNLDAASFGKVIAAALEYATEGEARMRLSDMERLALEVLKPQIDADRAQYNSTVQKRQYAAYCRTCTGEKPTYDDWYHMIAHDST